MFVSPPVGGAKSWITLGVLAVAILAFIGGVLIWVLSLRPVGFRLAPGDWVVWKLTTTATEQLPNKKEGRTTVEEQSLLLIGLGPDGLCAYLTPVPGKTGRSRIDLVRMGADGSVSPLDAALRDSAHTRAVGIFDLDLLQFPPSGSLQIWDADVAFGLLPPGKSRVQAHIKRSKAGARPEFTLRLPTSVEWPDERGMYRQVKDFTCIYRHAGTRQLVDQATIRCLYGIEQPEPDGRHVYKVHADLRLGETGTALDDPSALQSISQACAAAQEALADPGISPQRRQEILAGLRRGEAAFPLLRRLTGQLEEDLNRPSTGPKPWWCIAASGPASDRIRATQLARTMAGLGLAAKIEESGTRLDVVIGPYPARDQGLFQLLKNRWPWLKPTWKQQP